MARKVMTAKQCRLLIDYDQDVVSVIKACLFDFMGVDITPSLFPNNSHEKGKTTLKAKLFHFESAVSYRQVLIEMNKQGFRAATFRELLAFAVKKPDVQRKVPVIGLGSCTRAYGGFIVPYLDVSCLGRELRTSWWRAGDPKNFHDRCRFLGVREL